MKNKPPYAIESVDNALRLLQALRDSGQVRVSDAAAELGIARSTAHRLLSMLVYRDFAVRTDDHVYLPGPALSAPPLAGEPAQRLRAQMRPHMEALRDRVAETVNLTVRIGMQTRFLHTVECDQLLRVGDRTGTILPAWHTSGGKALLAALPDPQLLVLLRKMPDAERRALAAELRTIRDRGYAENIEESESGVCAVGMCVRNSAGEAVAALSLSAPSVRYSPERSRVFVRELRSALDAVSLLPVLSSTCRIFRPHRRVTRMSDDGMPPFGRRVRLRISLAGAMILVGSVFTVLGIAFVSASFFTSSQASLSAYTQSHGVRESAVVRNVAVSTSVHCPSSGTGRRSYGGGSGNCSESYDARVTVGLGHPVGGHSTSVVHVAQNVSYASGQSVPVLVDPQNPGYSELPGSPYVTQTTVLVFEILGGVFLVLGLGLLAFGLLRRRRQRRFA